MDHEREVLIRPVISEKAVTQRKDNKYVFKVDSRTTKSEVKKAVQGMFGVTVVQVNMVKMPAKNKRLGRFEGMTNSWKKAVVQLKQGDTIKAFDIT